MRIGHYVFIWVAKRQHKPVMDGLGLLNRNNCLRACSTAPYDCRGAGCKAALRRRCLQCDALQVSNRGLHSLARFSSVGLVQPMNCRFLARRTAATGQMAPRSVAHARAAHCHLGCWRFALAVQAAVIVTNLAGSTSPPKSYPDRSCSPTARAWTWLPLRARTCSRVGDSRVGAVAECAAEQLAAGTGWNHCGRRPARRAGHPGRECCGREVYAVETMFPEARSCIRCLATGWKSRGTGI